MPSADSIKANCESIRCRVVIREMSVVQWGANNELLLGNQGVPVHHSGRFCATLA
ncbi:hypothetical protein FHX77_001007 [Bifidobacterium commune]|uniref:Uncharacterized protein n=1 Tax=Bifidobacterium commune TaxID=1505727 RepID=A0A1C4H6T3_9BIFI|nr:hypothetical protein [Bifidobacterium commune]SCC80669.1 hypothetical protein GA0061077_1307 [Bifidobacterium commune]